MDLGAESDTAIDAIETIRARLTSPRLVIPPTPQHELAHIARHADTAEERDRALAGISAARRWRIVPINLMPVGHGIVERVAGRSNANRMIKPCTLGPVPVSCPTPGNQSQPVGREGNRGCERSCAEQHQAFHAAEYSRHSVGRSTEQGRPRSDPRQRPRARRAWRRGRGGGSTGSRESFLTAARSMKGFLVDENVPCRLMCVNVRLSTSNAHSSEFEVERSTFSVRA